MKLDDFEFGSRLVATHASNAHVVKAFNTLYARFMDGDLSGSRRFLAIAGDEFEAKNSFTVFAKQLGFFVKDLGNLDGGEELMHFGSFLSANHFTVGDDVLDVMIDKEQINFIK
ncbi:hypothetical protein EFE32_08445, partial [Lactococcus lactis subsp. lactis]|nr:hypothetical protein [Lactococcus lactis subsp. lactis]